MPEDPYADPVTGVLRNKLGLTTARELEDAEREITHAALVFLKEAPVPPAYDLGHLCAIHRRILGDIYDWAGQLRTVAIAKGSWFCLLQYIESSLAGEAGFILDWQRLDADRNIAASAAIMGGDPTLMRKMLDELVLEP